MAAESTTHIIFFIAAIIVASSMAVVFIGTGGQIADSIGRESDSMRDQLDTRMAIINDPVMMPYNNGVLTVYVENLGDSAIIPSSLTVILDGVYINNTVYTILGGSGAWGSSTVLQIDIIEELAQGDHYVKISTSSGVSESLDFRI